jgi:hypothetical protein
MLEMPESLAKKLDVKSGGWVKRNSGDHRLAVLAVEGEYGLRIDYCEACGGYLKTYIGEGSEDVLLADWTSVTPEWIGSCLSSGCLDRIV